MRKILLLLPIILAVSFTSLAQSYELTVSGTVYSMSGNTMIPVPDQEVTVTIDSIFSGFYYENTVMTDSAGSFADLVDFGSIPPMGFVHVSTYDPCLGTSLEQVEPFMPGNPVVYTEFYLCDTIVGPCQAAFIYFPSDPMGMMTGSFQFIDISTGNPTEWLWDFGDGTQSTEQNPEHVFPDEGVYTVCLTVSDSTNYCTSTFCEDVFVVPGPGGCHNFFHYYPTGVEFEFTFEGFLMCGDTAAGYTWDFGDGTTGTGQTVTHLFPADTSQVFTVCLTTTVIRENGDTCVSTSCKDVNMMPPPPQCSNFFTFSEVDSLTFNFQGEAYMGGMIVNDITEFYWDFGDGTTSTGQTVTHTFPADSVTHYFVCLTTYTIDPQTGDTCNASFCHPVHLNTWPGSNCMSNFMHYPGEGLIINFEGFTMSQYPTEYNWEFGDGTTGTGQAVSHEYDSTGLYTVTLSTVDSSGCAWTTAREIMVMGPPEFDITGTVYLDSALTADEGIVRLITTDSTWQTVIVLDSVDIQPDGTYLFDNIEMGPFPLYFTQAELGPGSAYFGDYLPTYHLDALAWEDAMFILPPWFWTADIYMVAGNTVTSGPGDITGSVNSPGARETMEGIHVMLLSEDHDPYIYVTTDAEGTFGFSDIALGTYIVRAEVMGVHNTETTVTLTDDNQQAGLNFVIDGNQAYLSVGEPGYVRLESVGDIYPNPVTEKATINITLRERSKVTLSIHDLAGNLISSSAGDLSKGSHDLTIMTRELAKGIYFLEVETGSGEQATRKLIKIN